MARLRHGRPLWLDRPKSATRKYPRHRGHLDVDVIVVGGGISGALCAYLFSDAGFRVALLESHRVARGSTLASTALLMQEPDRDFDDLARRFGARAAREIWMALAGATRDLTRTIRKLGLHCDLHGRDSVYFTLDPRAVASLRKELTRRKRAGLHGRWLSPSALFRVAGIRAPGGILTRGNADVHPVRACHGFLRAAASRGARIFEQSRAKSIKASRDGVVVRTPAGTLTADVVVIATGYARPGFEPLVGRFRMKDTYVIATRPLPRRLRRAVPRSRAMAWDTDRPYHFLRWTDDGRLLLGGEDTVHRTAKGSRTRIANARARLLAFLGQVYPSLASEKPEHSWEGLFAETPDGLPYIGRHSRYPRHLFALGYGGNGMTASFLAAQLLLNHYVAGKNGRIADRTLDLFAFGRGRR